MSSAENVQEIQLSRDIAMIRRSRQNFMDGKCENVRSAFAELRAELLVMQNEQNKGTK